MSHSQSNGGPKPLSDTDLFAALTQVKEYTPMLAQALADHIGARAQALTAHHKWLAERADWLRREYLNGGNYEHLKAREDECRYIAEKVAKLMEDAK